jgi:hypothetical protein
VLEGDSETEGADADVSADSSGDSVSLDPSKRARARGQGGGFMASIQSKWDTSWRNTNKAQESTNKPEDSDDAPEGWSALTARSSRAGAALDDSSALDHDDVSEELVGDRFREDEEVGSMWGFNDQHRTGNVYTPGDPTGRDRRPQKIIDRGSLTGTVGVGSEEAQNAQVRVLPFAAAGGMGPREEDVDLPDELCRAETGVQSSTQLQEAVSAVSAQVRQVQTWYRNLQAQQLQRTQSLVLQGRPQEALEEMRSRNVMHAGTLCILLHHPSLHMRAQAGGSLA